MTRVTVHTSVSLGVVVLVAATEQKAGTADGFTFMPADTAVDLANFATLVVPILQRRGLFQTLRGRPAWPPPEALV
ncbi:hypothetical protein ACFQX7_34055 [Luedemannella flava]